MKVKIKSVNEIDSRGHIYVSLCNMRADLTDNIEINPQDITNYWGVDANGYSVEHRIKAGVVLECNAISHSTRRLESPKFLEE